MSKHVETKKEQISALIDGEQAEMEQTLDLLLNDADARDTWADMHKTRDIMSGDVERVASAGFASSVMAALDAEPTVLAPQASVEQEEQPKPGTAVLPAFLRPLAGLAVAATVAAVTVFSFDGLLSSGDSASESAQVAEVIQPIQTPAQNPAIATVRFTGEYNPDRTKWQGSDEAVQQQLNQYLANHTEYSGSMQGMLPYVRLAGYDSEKAQQE